MNTKKTKNKQKQHKPPIPQPTPEAADVKSEKPEKIEQTDVNEKTELIKSEERVPEIVSEIVQPILEAKMSESDAPKKPKRNRGKKKKSDKGDEADEMPEEPVLDYSNNAGKIKDSKDVNVTVEKSTEVPAITPATRKNKNKKHFDQIERQSEQEVKIATIKKEEELTELKIITVVPVATEGLEESKSKKKNKKKKRIDSERSDKAEEIVSCTSAFQKLLEPRDDKKDLKKDTIPEDIKSEKETVPIQDAAQGQSLKPAVETKTDKQLLKPEVATRDRSTEKLKEESGKGKKKNKKDKKHPPKEESEDESSKPFQTKTEIDSEGQTVTVPTNIEISTESFLEQKPEHSKSDTEKISEPIPLIEKEKSPKPKAKIAKPVGKKRKEKQDVSSTENLSENILLEDKSKICTELQTENIRKEEKPIIAQPTKIISSIEQEEEAKVCDVSITKAEDSQIIQMPDIKRTEVKPDLMIPETEKIQLPESGSSKKRKKSPKPKPGKHLDATAQITATTEPTSTKHEEKEDLILLPEITTQTEVTPKRDVKLESTSNLSESNIVPLKENESIPLSFELSTPQDSPQVKILETSNVSKEQEIAEIVTEKTTAKEDVAIEKNIEKKILEIPNVSKEQEIAEIVTEKTTVKEDVAIEKNIEKEKIQSPESSMGKKRKKSPKPQKKAGHAEFTELSTSSTDILKSTPQKEKCDESKTTEQATSAAETTKEIPKEQPMTSSISDLPKLEDIEIRSVKADESEGSACDIIPDIHYPRASSQLLDDNNNTVIRDVTFTDVKLNIPNILPDTPIIQGSGETPLPVLSDSMHPCVTITEISSSVPKQEEIAATSKAAEKDISYRQPEEKTDLKSKVMDVNQGMEELRRSIERSLAELSSMEKSGKEAEDQFFKAQAKLEQITEMATKKSEEKKQMVETKQTQEKTVGKQKEPIQEITTQINKDTEKTIDKSKPFSKPEEIITKPVPLITPSEVIAEIKTEEPKPPESTPVETHASQTPPVPSRKDNKGKGKKKKGKQESENSSATTATSTISGSSGTTTSTATADTKKSTQDTKKDEKSEQKPDSKSQEKGKQQSASHDDEITNKDKAHDSTLTASMQMDFEPIENFEDALYASVDENEQEVNKTFEMIANEANQCDESQNPKINVTAPIEDEDNTNNKKEHEKVNPVSQPKNLLGHPDIPARLNRTDYKKEKNKHQTPNTKQATVKIKDAVPIEVTKECKESQTENKRRFIKDKTVTESITSMTSENEEYIYKYSFRKVFLPSACHVCKKDLKSSRVPCNFCNLIFYCSVKHKDEDYQQHQGLCFAVSTVVHLRDQKHIYADAKNVIGQEYRLLRMQMIVSCERVLKRRLVPWEQEALLYPRICAEPSCREWRQSKLMDCEGCGQIAYCSDDPTHLPKSHQRWCKSYSLYNKLVVYQQTRGRLEPTLPSRVMAQLYQIPGKLNEVLANMYEEKIDMTDIQYAALTQIATAPLTAVYCHQLYNNKMNTIYANGVAKKSSFTIHVVGAELQFEADALNKWEVFFLHLRPDVKDLRVVLIAPDLNPSKLPLDLLSKIKLCENCRQNKRRVLFEFQDKKTYYEYWSSDFTTPDLVCAFNPSIQRSSVFNGKDTWPSTIRCILKLKVPFIITSYTMSELQKDLARIKECSEVEVNTISEAEFNAFASVRPDRNFISDDEMPLLFKNFCFSTVCGAF